MKLKKYLPIIGIFLFIYILIRIDIIKAFEEVVKADIFLLSTSVVLVLLLLTTQTLKWFIIAKKQEIKIRYGFISCKKENRA